MVFTTRMMPRDVKALVIPSFHILPNLDISRKVVQMTLLSLTRLINLIRLILKLAQTTNLVLMIVLVQKNQDLSQK